MAGGGYPLDLVRVASPCPVSWEGMSGDERVRFCTQCQNRVYNLSALSRREAEELVQRAEGRLCVRFYRRADGTVMTADCPVGLQALRRRLGLIAGAAATGLLLLLGWGMTLLGAPGDDAFAGVRKVPVVGAILDRIIPRPRIMMGAICPSPGPPTLPVPGGDGPVGPPQPEPEANP